MTYNPFHSIDPQTYQRLQARARTEWHAAPQPFRPLDDLDPFYRELDLAVLELSRRTRTPYSLLTRRPRPRLQDRLWSRLQSARRLYWKLLRR